MKIDIVLGPFLSIPPRPTGAVERVWQDLAAQFTAKGHSVRLIGKHLGRSPLEGLQHVSVRGEERCGNLAVEILKDVRYANRAAAKIVDADIVVTNTISLPVVLNAKRRNGAAFKIVVNLARMPKGHLFLYKNSDKIAVVSNAVLLEVERQDRDAYGKSVVVENPVDCDIFNAEGREENRGEIRTILYTGRVCREKGLEFLIAAVKLLQTRDGHRYRLRIVGPYEREQGGDGTAYLDELKTQASELPVEFVGPIWDRRRLADEYRSADIFIYPSIAEKGETFGVAPLEAMACGAVTVVSNLECFRQYLTHGINGLAARIVGNRDPGREIYQLIRELETKTRYEALQKNGIETARKFDNSTIAEKYLSEFRKLLNVER